MNTLKQRLISLLRFSESFTKIDMVYAFKGGFWISFAQGSSSVLSLLLIIAFANLAPKELYGMYQYVLSLAGVLNVFSLTGMNSAVARAVAAGHEGVLTSSVRYQLTWNLLMTAAFWTLGGYYLYNGNTELATAMTILGVFVPGTLAFNTYGAYLEGKRKFAFASIATIASSATYVAGMISVLVLGGNLIALVAVYALVTFIPTLFFYLLVARKTTSSADTPTHVLTYGRKLSLINILEPVAGQIDKILLAHFWGPADLAVYSLALAVPNRATSFIKSWVGVGFPKFAQKNPTELNSVFFRRVIQSMAIGGILAIGYIALSPLLFTYLLPKYLESIVYSQILALGFLFAMPNRYVSLLLVSQQYSRLIFTNSLVQTSLRIVLFAALGIWGGIYGLVLAHVIVAGLGMIINITTWKKGVASSSA